jgi:hypothetical protein
MDYLLAKKTITAPTTMTNNTGNNKSESGSL